MAITTNVPAHPFTPRASDSYYCQTCDYPRSREWHATPQEREDRALIAANNAARDAIGAVLVSAYPEAVTGDEDVSAVEALMNATEAYARAWIRANLPKPLTLADAVVVLINTRNTLMGSIPHQDADPQNPRALAIVNDALARAPMTEDDLPRP